MKRILLISSSFTGHGHASIAQSITEQLDKLEGVEYDLVDGFSLIGKAGVKMSKIYGPITRNASDLWKYSYALFDQHPRALLDPLTVAINERLMKRLNAFQPHMIATVHPFFNGSVIDILEHYRLNIPVYAVQADIINIHGAWCDKRAALTLCPTQEAYECSVQRGMPPEKLRVCGFPTRAQFCDAARAGDAPDYDGTRPLNCLLMSGGEGSGNLLKFAARLLNHTSANLSVICGRNEKMTQALTSQLKPIFQNRLTVYGFLDNVSAVMQKSDLIIARGSPNTLMEAVVLGVPLLITGSLPGQEADNPALMVAHNLAAICENAVSLPSIIHALTANGGRRLREIRLSQRAYRNLDNAANIARLLADAPVPDVSGLPTKRLKIITRPATVNF